MQFASILGVITVLVAVTPACSFLVSADTPGEHCAMHGTPSACFTCMQTNCQLAVDRCCGDDHCAEKPGVLAQVDDCVAGKASSCAYLTTETDTKGFAGVVRACLANQCQDVCVPKGQRAPTQCALAAGGAACSCKRDVSSNGVECSLSTLTTSDNTLCAIDVGDAATGTCQCGPYRCTETSGSCHCTWFTDSSDWNGHATTCERAANSFCYLGTKSYGSGAECTCCSYSGCSDGIAVTSCNYEKIKGLLTSSGLVPAACSVP